MNLISQLVNTHIIISLGESGRVSEVLLTSNGGMVVSGMVVIGGCLCVTCTETSNLQLWLYNISNGKQENNNVNDLGYQGMVLYYARYGLSIGQKTAKKTEPETHEQPCDFLCQKIILL